MRANRGPRGRRESGEPPGSRASLEVHIEELVLHGFAPQDRYRIGDAVERELARLLESQGLAATFGASMACDRIDAGSFPVRPGAPAEAIGWQTAHALHRSIGTVPRVR